VLTAIGGKVIEINNEIEIENYVAANRVTGKTVISVLINEKVDITKDELYTVDIAIIRGGVAVAENGTIWVTEKNMGNRMLPFSCEQLVIVIEAKDIVNNMHEAYDKINIAEDGYGVFIAGPSKTADIEQSLVIGAHGPVSFLVFILN
jgi:L-lactate dehydrogenase complex protein LldG